MFTIEDLDEDCLREIFSYLNIHDRQRTEQVCKRWRSINRIMWRSMRNLKFKLERRVKTIVENIDRNGLQIRSDNIFYLGDVLKMFDGNLTKLVIKYRDSPFESLDPPIIPNEILQLIKANKKIVSVKINYSIFDLMQILKVLPTYHLQHLSINLRAACRMPINEILEEVFQNAPQLISLECDGIPPSLSDLFNQITTLKSLEINSGSLQRFNTSKLINLEKIVLIDTEYVDDNFMLELVKNCQKLHTVVIGTDDVTADGMNAVISLPNLRYLDTQFLNDELFNNLSNLEVILCEEVQCDFSEYKLTKFLLRSPNLKQFNFTDELCNDLCCKLITKLGMNATEMWEISTNEKRIIACLNA